MVLGLACAYVGACAAPLPERQAHVVVPPRTAEVSEGFGPDPPRPVVGDSACPMQVEGADVVLTPVRGGTALVFTTPLASPVEVRRRAWSFASLYDADGSTAPGLQPPERSPAGFPTSAQYSEVVAGARVEIRPLGDEDLQKLRAHLERLAAHMRMTQTCCCVP